MVSPENHFDPPNSIASLFELETFPPDERVHPAGEAADKKAVEECSSRSGEPGEADKLGAGAVGPRKSAT